MLFVIAFIVEIVLITNAITIILPKLIELSGGCAFSILFHRLGYL